MLVAAADGGLETAAPCWLPTAREEAMAPTAATTAATKNSEQKMRRHFEGVNVGVEFEFVVMEVVGAFGLFDWLVERKPKPPVRRQRASVCQTFSAKFYILKHEPGGCRTKKKRCLRLIAPPANRVLEVLDFANAFGVGSAMRFRIAFGRIGADG